jgi:pimeloyl-ACP methyl ester carboxylesterase
MSDGTTVQRHRVIDESYRTIGDVRTRMLELAGSGPPLICLHGYSDLADTWRPLMRAWRGTDRHVIAVDMPGFGHAAPLRPGPVLPQLDGFVAALVADAAGAAGQPAFVIGNSLGGMAALHAAANADLPLGGIVPISPAGFVHSKAILWAERHDELVPMLQRGRLPVPVMRRFVAAAFRRAACGNPRHADHEAVQAYANQFRTRADIERLFTPAAPILDEIRAMVHAQPTAVPVLLLWGDRDRLTLHRGSKQLVELIPHTDLVTLHGCGHCPQLECAPRIASLIGDFVDRTIKPHAV